MNALQVAAKCAMADLIGLFNEGGLPKEAEKTIVELHTALAADGVDVSDYDADVANVTAFSEME